MRTVLLALVSVVAFMLASAAPVEAEAHGRGCGILKGAVCAVGKVVTAPVRAVRNCRAGGHCRAGICHRAVLFPRLRARIHYNRCNAGGRRVIIYRHTSCTTARSVGHCVGGVCRLE